MTLKNNYKMFPHILTVPDPAQLLGRLDFHCGAVKLFAFGIIAVNGRLDPLMFSSGRQWHRDLLQAGTRADPRSPLLSRESPSLANSPVLTEGNIGTNSPTQLDKQLGKYRIWSNC